MLDTLIYRYGVNGFGELSDQWEDKPHRLVYSLCSEIERLQLVLLESDKASCIHGELNCTGEWLSVKGRIDTIKSICHQKGLR